jgi:hypothetical protein
MMLAPGASSSTPLRFPGSAGRLPRLDDSLLPEDAGFEILDGQRIQCMGDPEHARPHAQLASVLWHYAGPGYGALVELTTRADTVAPPPDLDKNAERLPATVQDLRPDASILRDGKDPATGDRYIEDLSFEVVNKQPMADLRLKAKRLRARGVRRVFAILVNKGQVVEWSAATGEFVPVVGEIRDPSLQMPLSVLALLQASEADDAVVRALVAKGNPALLRLRAEEHRQGQLEGRREGQVEGHREGEEAGLRQAVFALCEVLEVQLTGDRLAIVDRANLADLNRLVQQLKAQRSWPAS